MVIHPSLNTFTMGDFKINCNRETRRISCMIVDSDKMDQTIVKQARNKKDSSDVFLISLHFAEDLTSVKSDFGDQFDQQLKQFITEFICEYNGGASRTTTSSATPRPQGEVDRLSTPSAEKYTFSS